MPDLRDEVERPWRSFARDCAAGTSVALDPVAQPYGQVLGRSPPAFNWGSGGHPIFSGRPQLTSAAAPEFSYIFEPTGFCEPSQSVS
jgi:hypothetical protein